MAKQALLTQLGIDRAKARPGGRYDLPDGPGGVPGMMLRVSERGVKTFALRFRLGDQQPRMTLGSASVLSLVAARTAARDALALVDQGIDPRKAKIIQGVAVEVDPAAAAAEADRNTVEAVVGLYAARHLRRNTRRASDAEALLRRDVVRAWGDRPIASVTKRDVIALIDEVVDRAPVVANRLLSLVQRWLDWCVERGIVETNPAAGIKPPTKEVPRQRTLTEDELQRVWRGFCAMAYPFGDLGRLLLLTGLRRGELANARWSQVDVERAVLTLPAASTKTAQSHVVPLVPQVLAILEAMPRIDGSDLLFPSGRLSSARPVSGFSKALAAAQRLSGTAEWSWHDLRRTCRTNLGRLGVEPHIGERVLGHAVGSDVARIYDLHRYEKPMRQALLLWVSDVERIVTGAPGKVMPLRAG